MVCKYNDIKENWITGNEYLPTIILNNIKEYAELNSAKTVSKKGRNLFCAGHVMSIRFSTITSNLKYGFVKRIVIPQTRTNENLYSVLGLLSWRCLNFLKVSVALCQVWYSRLNMSLHSHKKQKDSVERRAAFNCILILTWNFGHGQSNSASTVFKTASASWFWCYQNYNWQFYM